MKYQIVGKSFQSVYREYGETDDYSEMIEAFYEEQLNTFNCLYPNDTKVIYHYTDSDKYTIGYTSEINDYIDGLAIKDGVNLVRFENGNYGFIGVYSGHENGLEIMPLSMPIVNNDTIGTMSKDEILDTLSEAINDLDNAQSFGTGDKLFNVILALKQKWGIDE